MDCFHVIPRNFWWKIWKSQQICNKINFKVVSSDQHSLTPSNFQRSKLWILQVTALNEFAWILYQKKCNKMMFFAYKPFFHISCIKLVFIFNRSITHGLLQICLKCHMYGSTRRLLKVTDFSFNTPELSGRKFDDIL